MGPLQIVVIGGSAGALDALEAIFARMPPAVPAAFFVVQHLGTDAPSRLPEIVQRLTAMPVCRPTDNATYKAGHLYIAPPDYHLLVGNGRMRLSHGPKENRFRPAVDALFRSAAVTHGSNVIAVVLSGLLDDGTAGAWSVKDQGGMVVVQDPLDAQFDSMPSSVLKHVGAHHSVPAGAIGALLVELTGSSQSRAEGEREVSKALEIEAKIAAEGRALQLGVMQLGVVTPYTCPECHGVLVELKEGGIPRFRCHTGHAYSLSTLIAEVTGYIENSLWNGLRAVEEAVLLFERAARHLGTEPSSDGHMRELLEQRAKQARGQAELLRDALARHHRTGEEDVEQAKQAPGQR